MQIETLSANYAQKENNTHVVTHRYRILTSQEPLGKVHISFYVVNGPIEGQVLEKTLRAAMSYEAANLEATLGNKIQNIHKDPMSAEDVQMIWREGRGCKVMVMFEGQNTSKESGVIDLTFDPPDMAGYMLQDFNATNERERKVRLRLREISQNSVNSLHEL